MTEEEEEGGGGGGGELKNVELASQLKILRMYPQCRLCLLFHHKPSFLVKFLVMYRNVQVVFNDSPL